MGIWERFRGEKRGEVPAGSVAISNPNFLQIITGMGTPATDSGVSVNIETALGVPAVWAAVNFLAGTLAGLPLDVYRRTGDSRKKVSNGVAAILHDDVNDEMSSFAWRKYCFDQVFTGGRCFTFIERDKAGAVMNLWPLDPNGVEVKSENQRRIYTYKEGTGRRYNYEAAEIIDIPFMLKADGVGHRGPIMSNKEIIGKAIAATTFGSRFFQNGGVPPFAVTGNFLSGASMKRAGEDLAEAVRVAAKEKRQALVMPTGLEIKSIGSDAESSQLVETQRFMVEEIARIYSLPPVFLQDLTHGTYSNTEQQDLHLVKHTLRRWVAAFEAEINLKVFGRKSRRQFAEFNMDGVLRGDFKTRMEGFASAIQNGVMKPNEARQKLNMPDEPGGDQLFMQGGAVPLGETPANDPLGQEDLTNES